MTFGEGQFFFFSYSKMTGSSQCLTSGTGIQIPGKYENHLGEGSGWLYFLMLIQTIHTPEAYERDCINILS